jgi:hypothetical protein
MLYEILAQAAAGSNWISGGTLGAVFGALGSAVNRGMGLLEHREARRDRQMELAHEVDRWAQDLKTMELAQTGAARSAGQALDLAATQGSWRGLEASLTADGQIGPGWPWVSALRALTRPVLTLLLWLILGLVLAGVLGQDHRDAADDQLIQRALEAVTFSASTALAWWFGDRAPGRPYRDDGSDRGPY